MICFSNPITSQKIIESTPIERRENPRERIEILHENSFSTGDMIIVNRHLSKNINALAVSNHKHKQYDSSIESELEKSIIELAKTHFNLFYDRLSNKTNLHLHKKICLIYIHERINDEGRIIFYPKVVKIFKPDFKYAKEFKDHLIFITHTLCDEDRIVTRGFATKDGDSPITPIVRQRIPADQAPEQEERLIDLISQQSVEVKAHFSSVLCFGFYTSMGTENITLKGKRVRQLLNMPQEKRIQEVALQEYVILPYYSNGDLNQYLTENKDSLTLERQKELGFDLLNGLQALFSLGYYHGDLKPENLLISEAGKILIHDYESNINYQAGEKWTGHANLHYIAPELWIEHLRAQLQIDYPAEKAVGPEMDLFVVGCVLHEIFFGEEHPYLRLREHFFQKIEDLLSLNKTDYAILSEYTAKEVVRLESMSDEQFDQLKKDEALEVVEYFFENPLADEFFEDEDLDRELPRQISPTEGPFGFLIDRLTDLNPETRLKNIDEAIQMFQECY